MQSFRNHPRLLALVVWIALASQLTLAFESSWHRHDDGPATRHGDCSVCAAISEHGQPIDPPQQAPTPQLFGAIEDEYVVLPAHLYALATLTSRGPPALLAL